MSSKWTKVINTEQQSCYQSNIMPNLLNIKLVGRT